MISPRIAPSTIGMGLLEAILEEDILALADPHDCRQRRHLRPRQTMSGTFAMVSCPWDVLAGRPTSLRWSSRLWALFLGDVGITSSLLPDQNCPQAQSACAQAPSGGEPELTEDRLEKVTIYTQTLAVPAMRNTEDEAVKQGARLFVQSQCSACHTPRHETGDTHPLEPLRGQVIYPYTDLLLHDMGEGLADNRPDGLATGTEWRTPPLWGIGLVEVVNGHTFFLHDGRARNLEEAILWHGGEAEQSRENFMGLTLEERNALLKFLGSL